VVDDIKDIISHLERVNIIDIDIDDRDKVRMTLDTLYKLNEIIMDEDKFTSLTDSLILMSDSSSP